MFLRCKISRNGQDRNNHEKPPKQHRHAKLELYQSVFVLSPPNAEPLLPTEEVYAYKICESPCGPGFAMLEAPNFATTGNRRKKSE